MAKKLTSSEAADVGGRGVSYVFYQIIFHKKREAASLSIQHTRGSICEGGGIGRAGYGIRG
jgi:hypothetical protein